MPDYSAIVTIPTNKVSLYINRQAGQTVAYSNLVGSTYATLAASTYGQLQNLAPTNADIAIIPTGKATIYLVMERIPANYLSIAASWGTLYSNLNGLSYGQLSVIP